jgi:hypothetical protein
MGFHDRLARFALFYHNIIPAYLNNSKTLSHPYEPTDIDTNVITSRADQTSSARGHVEHLANARRLKSS